MNRRPIDYRELPEFLQRDVAAVEARRRAAIFRHYAFAAIAAGTFLAGIAGAIAWWS